MSKLEEIIKEYCPDGVEILTISDIALKFTDGMHNLPKTSSEKLGYPILSAQNINNGLIDMNASKYVDEDTFNRENKRTNVEKGDLLLTIVGAIGRVAVVENDLKALFQRSVCVIKPNNDIVTSRYLRYTLGSTTVQAFIQLNAHGAAQKGIYLKDVGKIKIPVPPLPVQREIVRILDNFTELTAELTARKKQYEYYRDELLNYRNDIPLLPLESVCDLQAGKAIKASEISDIETKQSNVPCYGANGLRGYVETPNQEGDKSIIGRQGALCGNVCYATGEYYATEHAIVVTDKGYFNNRYLFHALTHANLSQYKTAGAQPGLSVSKLNKVKIAVPDKQTQDKIANVLDNFDSICSDLNIGLPAEIEARQKQYEYYRDALLTFAETCKIIDQTDRQTDRQTSNN